MAGTTTEINPGRPIPDFSMGRIFQNYKPFIGGFPLGHEIRNERPTVSRRNSQQEARDREIHEYLATRQKVPYSDEVKAAINVRGRLPEDAFHLVPETEAEQTRAQRLAAKFTALVEDLDFVPFHDGLMPAVDHALMWGIITEEQFVGVNAAYTTTKEYVAERRAEVKRQKEQEELDRILDEINRGQ